MKINWIFFGLYFCTVAAVHVLHVFLIDPEVNSSTYLFGAYTLLECALETALLFLCAYWIQRALPRLMNLFVMALFLLLCSHLIDFALVRFVDMSFWYALHFAAQETYSNLIELLIASNVSLWIWLLMVVGGAGLVCAGLFFYRLTDRWNIMIPTKGLFLTISALVITFISLDMHLSSNPALAYLDRLEKALPWKKNLFSAPLESLLVEAPLEHSASEEELMRHLDSRAFSLQHQPDIYLFVIESLRHDVITEEIAPHIHQFKQANLSFPLSFSNANATHLSWYALFHSRFPFEWKRASLEERKSGALPLRLLKQMGYKIHVASSARLNYYQMHEILLGDGQALADSVFVSEGTELYKRDEAAIHHLVEEMGKPGSGRVFLVFLDATHFDYSWPREKSCFFPYQEKIDYLGAMLSKTGPEPLINRYKNAVHFVDSLFGEFMQALSKTPGGEEAVVVLTGDHGEEFYEQGNLFHNSGLSYQQITPPIYYRLSQTPAEKPTQTTCHMDIFPTIFHYLIGEDLMQPVLRGQSIFKKERWPFTLIARFNASRTPTEYCLHSNETKLIFALGDEADPCTSKELKILSKKNLHDVTLPQDVNSLQEEFGPALRRLFPKR
jgi:hypothetical protein